MVCACTSASNGLDQRVISARGDRAGGGAGGERARSLIVARVRFACSPACLRCPKNVLRLCVSASARICKRKCILCQRQNNSSIDLNLGTCEWSTTREQSARALVSTREHTHRHTLTHVFSVKDRGHPREKPANTTTRTHTQPNTSSARRCAMYINHLSVF